MQTAEGREALKEKGKQRPDAAKQKKKAAGKKAKGGWPSAAPALYFECSAGISGDMAVAALIDLGADRAAIDRALGSLGVEGFTTQITQVSKHGLSVCDFAVVLDAEHENHDHDMAYLHGAGSAEAPSHHHEHHDPPSPFDVPHHDHPAAGPAHHHHEARGLADIEAIIARADMAEGAKALAQRIFFILADAEAAVHGTSIEKIHFHEVGAIDSIADIVAFAVAFNSLGIEDVVIPQISEGRGQVRCQHGIIPVPAPATSQIAMKYGLDMAILDVQGELVTPTGAAICAAVRTKRALPASFRIAAIGMGNGKRTYETSGILRVMVIE